MGEIQMLAEDLAYGPMRADEALRALADFAAGAAIAWETPRFTVEKLAFWGDWDGAR